MQQEITTVTGAQVLRASVVSIEEAPWNVNVMPADWFSAQILCKPLKEANEG